MPTLLCTGWKDKDTNEKVRRRTGMTKRENIWKLNRSRSLVHLHHMVEKRFARHALHWKQVD